MLYPGAYAAPRLDLGQAVMETILDTEEYIGTKVLPIFETGLKAASFTKLTRASFLRRRKLQRAAKAAYARDVPEGADDSYECREWALEGLLDDSQRALYASDFDAEKAVTLNVLHSVLREQDARVAALIFNTTTWTGAPLFTSRSGTPWTTVTVDIITHVKEAREKVRQNTGVRANALIVGEATLNDVLNNDGVRAALGGFKVQTWQELQQFVAPILGLERIISGGSVLNSANEGLPFVGADTWDAKYAMIARIATGASLEEPQLGRTFLWTADSPQNTTVEAYRAESNRSDVFRCRQHTAEKVFDAAFGHLLQVRP